MKEIEQQEQQQKEEEWKIFFLLFEELKKVLEKENFILMDSWQEDGVNVLGLSFCSND